jgi:sulfur-carrier protein
MVRVTLPTHLKTLARVAGEVELELEPPVTIGSALTALEARYPVLRGSIRDHVTLRRRNFVRFFACQEDLSLESPDTPLPDAVVRGDEPLMIIGAVAGG